MTLTEWLLVGLMIEIFLVTLLLMKGIEYAIVHMVRHDLKRLEEVVRETHTAILKDLHVVEVHVPNRSGNISTNTDNA